jgi:hypothetical protein
VSCDHGRGAGTVVADPAVVRACHADGSWSAANPSCEPCCGGSSRCGSCGRSRCGHVIYNCGGGQNCCGCCDAAC